MKRVLFFITCQIIFFTHFIHGAKNLDEAPCQVFIRNLSDDIGIRWSVISPPAGFTDTGAYHMLSPDDGTAPFSNGTLNYLCNWDGAHWRSFFNYKGSIDVQLFNVQNIIWFTSSDTIQYRSVLKIFDGNNIHTIPTPQANGIRSLFFSSPNDGWAGCEWGQLMYWDGREWRLTPGFTSYHTESIFAAGDSLLFAKNDIPAHSCSEFFSYKKTGWHKIQKLAFRNGNDKVIFLQNGKYYLAGTDSLFFWRNKEWQTVNVSKIPKDTLVLPIACNPGQLVWASPKGPVRTNNFIYLENQSACNDSDIICIVPMERSNEAANEKTFFLFSKTGLQKALHIIAKDYLPAKKSIRFQTSKILQSGNEAGLCIADFTGDGKEDVYAVVTGAANRLYPASETKTPGRFDEIAEKAGVLGGTFTEGEFFNYDNSVSCADIDNDGDEDILVTSLYGPSVLFRQIKKGRFVDHTRTSRLDRDHGRSFLGIWADVDRDGCIDLFVNNSDSASHLYQNNGAGIFVDITSQAGLSEIRSSAAAFGDIDNDGDDDLLCAAGSRIRLLKNNSRDKNIQFKEQPLNLITDADSLAPISNLFLADLDNDGDLDIFATRIMAPNLLLKNEKGIFVIDKQPGMQEREYSIEAAPLDADNDGDLDIFVSNRGSISFYENLGKIKFRKVRAVDVPVSNGGAIAVGDFQNDGDLDIYTSDNEAYSRTLFNTTDNQHFIKLKLVGAASNRNAIGARVDIYRADSSRQYLGMRSINGGEGTSSSSSRIIHIGVPDSAGRNFVIRFPSGRIRHIDHVTAGQFLIVREYAGFAWKLRLLKNWFRRKSHYIPLQKDIIFLAAMSALFVIIFISFRKTFIGTPQSAFFLLWLPIFLLISLFLILHRNSYIYDYLIPGSFSAGAWLLGLVMVMVQKLNFRQERQPEIEEALYFKTAAFFHGEWGASRLNSLALFLANFDSDAIADSDVATQFTKNIDDFFTLLAPAIGRILSLSSRLPTLREQQRATQKTFDNFVADLNDVKVQVALGEISDTTFTSRVLENLSLLQQNIKVLRRHVSKHFATPISESLHNLVSEKTNSLNISLGSGCPRNLYGRIRPAEFSQIVDNLIHNAKRATKDSLQKQLTIKCRTNMDRIFISFADNGCGVPKKLKNRLFAEQVTSKAHSGGLGLYHAARILARYGGKITLLSTQENKGTTFLLELKRVDDE